MTHPQSIDAPGTAAAVEDDFRYMQIALALGARGLGLTAPNPAVGAIVVAGEGADARIVGRGWTQPGGRPHAERRALDEAGEYARGATLYVTLEPCSHQGLTSPCAEAAIAAGVRRVVSAVQDPDPRVSGRGHDILRAAGIEVTTGICAAEARRAHRGHITRVTLGRPMVQLKMAISADGMVGLGSPPRPVAISSPEAFGRAHMLRAQADAIMLGAGTVLADNPSLTCRLPGMADRSPIRVIIDARLRTPIRSELVHTAHEVPLWIIGTEAGPLEAEHVLRAAGAEVMRVETDPDGHADLAAVLKLLGTRGITRVMSEGGPRIGETLLARGLVDEALIAQSDKVLGPEGIPAFSMPVMERMEAAGLHVTDERRAGGDRLIYFERR